MFFWTAHTRIQDIHQYTQNNNPFSYLLQHKLHALQLLLALGTADGGEMEGVSWLTEWHIVIAGNVQ